MPSWLDVKESKTVSKEILKNGPNMKKKHITFSLFLILSYRKLTVWSKLTLSVFYLR